MAEWSRDVGIKVGDSCCSVSRVWVRISYGRWYSIIINLWFIQWPTGVFSMFLTLMILIASLQLVLNISLVLCLHITSTGYFIYMILKTCTKLRWNGKYHKNRHFLAVRGMILFQTRHEQTIAAVVIKRIINRIDLDPEDVPGFFCFLSI